MKSSRQEPGFEVARIRRNRLEDRSEVLAGLKTTLRWLQTDETNHLLAHPLDRSPAESKWRFPRYGGVESFSNAKMQGCVQQAFVFVC